MVASLLVGQPDREGNAAAFDNAQDITEIRTYNYQPSLEGGHRRMAIDAYAVRLWEGESTQLGATWDGLGVNFSLFSANATKVELCLFDPSGAQELQRIELPEYTDEVWHGYLPDAGPGTV